MALTPSQTSEVQSARDARAKLKAEGQKDNLAVRMAELEETKAKRLAKQQKDAQRAERRLAALDKLPSREEILAVLAGEMEEGDFSSDRIAAAGLLLKAQGMIAGRSDDDFSALARKVAELKPAEGDGE